MSNSSDDPRGILEEIEQNLISANRGKRNVTGVIRWYWSALGPLLEAGYVRVADLAQSTGISVHTIRRAVHRVRRETKHSAAPYRRAARADHQPLSPEPLADAGLRPRRRPRPAEPEATPPTPDAWIDLGDGRRYRRKPGMPNFFEIWNPGKDKPDITEVQPKPRR